MAGPTPKAMVLVPGGAGPAPLRAGPLRAAGPGSAHSASTAVPSSSPAVVEALVPRHDHVGCHRGEVDPGGRDGTRRGHPRAPTSPSTVPAPLPSDEQAATTRDDGTRAIGASQRLQEARRAARSAALRAPKPSVGGRGLAAVPQDGLGRGAGPAVVQEAGVPLTVSTSPMPHSGGGAPLACRWPRRRAGRRRGPGPCRGAAGRCRAGSSGRSSAAMSASARSCSCGRWHDAQPSSSKSCSPAACRALPTSRRAGTARVRV